MPRVSYRAMRTVFIDGAAAEQALPVWGQARGLVVLPGPGSLCRQAWVSGEPALRYGCCLLLKHLVQDEKLGLWRQVNGLVGRKACGMSRNSTSSCKALEHRMWDNWLGA
jgi:hypothetical protein